MPNRNQGTFLATSGSNAFILRRQRGVFGFGRSMGNFDKDLPQPATAFPRFPA